MKKGFTLIEMMIVVAIIAIIAAIAIPSLLAARRNTLETNAVGSCRAYASAQTIFKRNDWDSNGVLEYARPFTLLNTQVDKTGQAIQLIDGAFAAAIVATAPKHGYWFADMATVGLVAIDWVNDYGLSTTPAIYARTGYRSFIINVNGTTFGQDLGAAVQTADYPANPLTAGWIVAE